MMKEILNGLASIVGKRRMIKWFFNLSPMYRNTGGRVVEASDDFHYVKIKLPLNYNTRNYVGTLYGGHMYSCVDGIYMVQLVNILGPKYVIWDKSASIRFRRPGSSTLYAEFRLEKEFIEEIKKDITLDGERDYLLNVDLCDKDGVVHANVEKEIYIASKEFYKKKKAAKRKTVA